MRLDAVERRHGVSFDWRPFSVRALMQEMNNVPFVGKPAKERYMWRDLERRAAHHGLPIRLPVEYPLEHFDLANRIAIVGAAEDWCPEYVRAAYRLWFNEGLPAGGSANVHASLEAAGQEPARVLELAATDPVGSAYEAATATARSLGIFGSPSFVVGGGDSDGELFWGDDRLEDAIAFASGSGRQG
jgi:2-hydroxychromene-2-carboxylate isomerase